MSLLVTVITKDGIIMASDSRTTYTHPDKTVTYQDGSKKTFVLNDKIGISTCRNASINNQTMEYHFKNFIDLYKTETIKKVPNLLKNYFLKLDPKCNVAFFVSGYDNNNKPHVYKVFTQEENVKLSSSSPCSYWEGEKNFASRAFGQMYVRHNKSYIKHMDYNLQIDKFSIKDGVDYAKFIISTSMEYMKFFDIKQTIGGNIDVLVIFPSGTFWY